MALGDISGLLQPLIDSAEGMTDAFVPMGRVMLALAVTLAILFATYDWWMGQVGDALGRIVRAGLFLTIPLTLMYGDNWTNSMRAVTHFFSAELTAPILSTTDAGSGPEAIKQTINKLSLAMFPNARHVDERNAFEQARDFLMSEQTIGGAVFSGLTEALFELLLFALAIFLSLALVVALYGPLLALQIGIIFGPLLLAWVPFQPLSHLARNWFQFILSQGFALVVGITVAMIGVASIEAYTDQMMGMATDASLPWFQELAAKAGGFMASSAVIVFVGFMLFKADDIAAAMIGGGGAGTGGVGAVILNKIAPRGTPKGGKGGGGGKD